MTTAQELHVGDIQRPYGHPAFVSSEAFFQRFLSCQSGRERYSLEKRDVFSEAAEDLKLALHPGILRTIAPTNHGALYSFVYDDHPSTMSRQKIAEIDAGASYEGIRTLLDIDPRDAMYGAPAELALNAEGTLYAFRRPLVKPEPGLFDDFVVS